MSVEAAAGHPRRPRPVGALADGTPCYAPVGSLLADGDRVRCHLCGGWFLSVASHLRVHGWTKAAYLEAFGLELNNPLTGPATRKRRAAALVARQVAEPAIQLAQARARARSRNGALTAAAMSAARGRPHPAERRAKTLAALGGISPGARAAGTREWARRRREAIAADVAGRFGFGDFDGYLRDRLGRGLSLAAISREAGLHKDWMCRHLSALAPAGLAQGRSRVHPGLLAIAHRRGFPDAAAYLRARHLSEHRTIAWLAREAGTSSGTIRAALRSIGVAPVAHASTRHQAARRGDAVAAGLGFDSLAAYVTSRRAANTTWRNLAEKSGVPESTLRRQNRSQDARQDRLRATGPQPTRPARTRPPD